MTGLLSVRIFLHCSSDVFALELLDGVLYLILQQGVDLSRTKLTDKRLDNGVEHTVAITMRSWGAGVMVSHIVLCTWALGRPR